MGSKEGVFVNEFGNPFPSIAIIFSYLLFPISLILLLQGDFGLTFLSVTISIYILFSRYGIVFDTAEKTYRNYTAIFTYKRGEVFSYAAYADIAILRKRITSRAISRGNATSTTSEWRYHLYLLDKHHRNRILIEELLSEDKAKEAAIKWANHLSVNYVSYKPAISERSKRNRRR